MLGIRLVNLESVKYDGALYTLFFVTGIANIMKCRKL